MQQAVTRKYGGMVLLMSAVVLASAVVLHPARPQSLAEHDGADTVWALSHWLIGLAGLLWIAGAVVLARQFNGTRGEAWATLAYGAALFGAVGLFTVSAIETFGFTGLETGTTYAETEAAFTALTYTMMGLAMMGTTAYYVAVALFGAAMLQSDAWPQWLAWSGIAAGAAAAIVTATSMSDTIMMVVNMVGMLWVALAGWTLMGHGRQAPAEEPAERVVAM